MLKITLAACLATSVMWSAENSAEKRLQDSATVVNEMMGMPDKGVPHIIVDKAQCIVVIPGLKKAAFIVGGQYGRGFASCRKPGGFGSPAAVRMEGGSFGFQLGGQSTDVILVVMNQGGMSHLLSDKFTIGADASAAAGPVGRDAKADTDVMMNAEILSYARSRGVYAGLSLEGATLRSDSDENRKLYGRAVSNKEILEQGLETPAVAHPLTEALNHSARK